MKKCLPNIILCLFVILCLLWSVYYIISMTDYCGVRVGEMLILDDDLPDSVRNSVHSINFTFFFQNRFGNLLVVECDDNFNVLSIECFNKHLVRKTQFDFRQIRPGTPVNEVLRKFGMPDQIDHYSSFKSFNYIGEDGGDYRVFVGRSGYLDGQKEIVCTREKSVYKDEQYLEPLSDQEYARILIVLSAGIIISVTAAVIVLLQLKKKGIFCKKKQATE